MLELFHVMNGGGGWGGGGLTVRATLSRHKNRTDLGKGPHQRDETQGHNSTQALSAETVLLGGVRRWRQADDKTKKETKARSGEELMIINKSEHHLCEPVWPSGKALGR